MTDFQIRSDNVDVEQIMRQIRARIREKRGVDYTEDEIKELARVKLEKFLDPSGVRSDLLQQFRRANAEGTSRNYKFENTTLYESSRGWLRFIRKLLNPVLKLFFNPNPLIDALHIQSDLNATTSRRGDLQYELIHNLVLETTRLGIQVKNLKMQVESMSSRLDFDERRARALEGVVQYRPGTVPPLQPPISAPREGREEAAQERRTRRRRRRGRRGPASAREGSSASFGEAGSASARDESSAGYGETGASGGEGSGASFGESSYARTESSGGDESNSGYRDSGREASTADRSDRRSESVGATADSHSGGAGGESRSGGATPSE